MKKTRLLALNACFLFILCSCGKTTGTASEIYGAELYNATFVVMNASDEYKQVIPVMSKVDLTDIQDVQIKGDGGTYDFRYEIEPRDYSLEGYRWYNLVLYFTNINISENALSIKNIDIYTDATNKIALSPDKCQFVYAKKDFNNEYIDINGSPLRIPAEMTTLPLELSANDDIKLKDIIVTNDSLIIDEYSCSDFGESAEFQPIAISKNSAEKTIEARFKISESELKEYKHYGTSIIVEYEFDGRPYYTVPAVSTTIYNPFDPDYAGIEKYYENVIKGK